MLLLPQPKLDRYDGAIDRWAVAFTHAFGMHTDSYGKLEALGIALTAIFLLQSIATYYRNYWASSAGHRLIFDLRYALYLHMQRLSHSFFDRSTSGGIVSRFTNDISLAQNFVGSAMINIWMDSASLGIAASICCSRSTRRWR